MNKFHVLFLSIAFFITTITAAQVKSADSLINRAFSAIQSNDEQAYFRLFPTYPQLKTFLASLVNSLPDTMMKNALGQKMELLTEEVYNNELKRKSIADFQTFIEKGKKMGINWSNATIDSFTTNENVEAAVNIKTMKGTIYFSSEG